MLIVGLGNPGPKYTLTRHNVGFMVIDELISSLNAVKLSSSSFNGELYKTTNHLLLKPLTFMNLSGESVIKVKNFYKIETQDIIVIHDDLDLPFGTIRFKRGGGHGGHNGLRSIDSHIGKEYIRIRIGIGKPEHKTEVASYVLSNFSTDEQKKLPEILLHVKEATLKLLDGETLEKVTSLYTIKSPRQ
ncbi:MAG: aminoacyl-tRNA hydrolase [Epsilonproteobacteria bacterium]|nr:aminoacyl-tRNA hydrolase [Campylobacterota bacterium]